MRRFIALILAALVMIALPACEKTPSCSEAVQRWWGPFNEGEPDPDFWTQYVEDDIALCVDLQHQAEGTDCMEAHVSWRECLYHRIGYGSLSGTPECRWRLERLQACLANTAFEQSCDDNRDNDADGLVDCLDPDCSTVCWGIFGGAVSVPQSLDRAVDLLFVIDNSASMAGEQANVRTNFPAYLTSLRNMEGGLPDLHLGVTSTDLGTGMYQISSCEEVGGDGGNLLTGNCTNPTGAPYIIDVAARGCEITMESNNFCSAHSCSQSDCAHEPSTTFVVDSSTGCPRCRNYANESLEDVFSCIADLGTMGCGFEQPLEAMRRALEPTNTANAGFVRDNAFLAVILVTDEDDCSASNPQLFDNTQTDLTSTLGPLTAYRCFEFGVTCDINSRTHQGTRQNCVPREDAAALLHPVSSYIQFLQDLKDPQEMVVAAMAGPVTLSPTGEGHNMSVDLDDAGNPELQYSCTVADGGAVPGIRIHNLIAAFTTEEDLAMWAYSTVCSMDFTPVLAGIGDTIKRRLDYQCLRAPPRGCADVGVEFGTPRAARTCAVNERCLPTCNVGEVRHRGTPDEYDEWLPPCLEVCADGYCEGNTDRSLAYAGGHPEDRDPDLPVEACWHMAYNENCPESNYASLRAARRADPPPRTFLLYSCTLVSRDEQLCHDEQDNDEDCLVDMDDPCCVNPANCVQ